MPAIFLLTGSASLSQPSSSTIMPETPRRGNERASSRTPPPVNRRGRMPRFSNSSDEIENSDREGAPSSGSRPPKRPSSAHPRQHLGTITTSSSCVRSRQRSDGDGRSTPPHTASAVPDELEGAPGLPLLPSRRARLLSSAFSVSSSIYHVLDDQPFCILIALSLLFFSCREQ